jgi:hypothetical protein
MNRLTAVVATLGGLAIGACNSSSSDAGTGLRVSADWNGANELDQLEFSIITTDGAMLHAPERRPSVAGGPLASGADVVIYLPDRLGGQQVRCLVTGYREGSPIQQGEAGAGLVIDSVVDVRVTLSSSGVDAGLPPDAGAGDAQTGGGKSKGQPCRSANECASGFCIDGVCCDGACAGGCQACNVNNRVGTCSPLPAGARDSTCRQDATSSCGFDGTCDGAGACRKYPAGTTCLPGACSGATLVGGGACDGNGTCAVATTQSCGTYTCDAAGRSCRTSCSASTDCVSPTVCSAAGTCGVWKPLGQACGNASECASGNCVDGVCCSTSACGRCFTCNLQGSAGTCQLVPSGQPEPHGVCAVQPVSTCGLNGTCDGSGGCANYPNGTSCRMRSTCMNGICR